MRLLCALILLAATACAESYRVQVNGRVMEIEREQYVAGVLAGESSVFRSTEALKAMAVAARTYAARFHGRHAGEGFDLCDKTHCQRYDAAAITERLRGAAQATAGELLLYQGKPALAYFHRDCGGHTESVENVWPEERAPYLVSHADPYCVRRKPAPWHWDASVREFVSALARSGLRTPPSVTRLTIEKRSASDRALQLGMAGDGKNERISASSLRFAIGRVFGFQAIPSDRYKAGISGNRVVFDGVGSGHGVGLCQEGAEQMGSEGRSYREILAFYYPGTAVSEGSARRRVSGERITLYSMRPDSALLAVAEREWKAAQSRVPLPAPANVEIREYPDVAAFRDATGEPGWVAARTKGPAVQMQPASVLRARGALETTLRHEFFHVLIEGNARAALPVWFREGLAGYYSAGSGANVPVHDTDIRQTGDPQRARAAYDAARGRVASLMARYGETAVLGWLKLGLPREVTNASAKQAPTKSK